MTPTEQLHTFICRLSKAGVDIRLVFNYPWVYLSHVNGKPVTETFMGNHGFTVAFWPIHIADNKVKWPDLSTTFALIRRYIAPE